MTDAEEASWQAYTHSYETTMAFLQTGQIVSGVLFAAAAIWVLFLLVSK